MTRGAATGWRDEVAGAGERRDGGVGMPGARRLIEALAFARLAAECAVRPALALLAELPETLYFERRERGACSQRETDR